MLAALAAWAGPASASLLRPATSADWARLPPHPRLYANTEQLGRIRARTDAVSAQLRSVLFSEAERVLGQAPIVYPSAQSILMEVREAQGRVLALSLAWRLGGEARFLDRARAELLALAALPNWWPGHFLDVGEAALAVGVGLDWLHDALSVEDRQTLVGAITRHALTPSLAVGPEPQGWFNGNFNWAQVCHGGLVVGALAVAEHEPALARRVLDRALANLGPVGESYAPDGANAEGPSYWSYGASFHVLLIEALRSSLGQAFGLEAFPGFLESSDYITQMVGPSGEQFNYSDHHVEGFNDPVLLWFARERRSRDLAREQLRALAVMARPVANPLQPPLKPHRLQPLALLWWAPELPDRPVARPRQWTARGDMPLGVLRSAWDDPLAAFVAIKGGTPDHSHGHMDVGSFVLELDGVRWAVDLGTESYDKMRAARLDLWNYRQDSSRWSTFRVGPEGHNILRFNGAYQQVSGKAPVQALALANGVLGHRVDLTSLYSSQVQRLARSVRLHPGRAISIEDAWTAGDQPVQASWQWLTRAKVSRTADGLRLQQQGQVLRLRWQVSGIARQALGVAVDDVSKARAPQDSDNPGLSRIVLTLPTPAAAKVRLMVLAQPGRA